MSLLTVIFVKKSYIQSRIHFIFLKNILKPTSNAFNTRFRPQSKDQTKLCGRPQSCQEFNKIKCEEVCGELKSKKCFEGLSARGVYSGWGYILADSGFGSGFLVGWRAAGEGEGVFGCLGQLGRVFNFGWGNGHWPIILSGLGTFPMFPQILSLNSFDDSCGNLYRPCL